MRVWWALVLLVALSACASSASQETVKESVMAQSSSYDPMFWVFGYGHPEHMQLMSDLGFMGVGFWAADRDGERIKYYFKSPTLEKYDWATQSQDRPNLQDYVARARAAKLKVMVNMEGVNPYHWEAGRKNWTPENIGQVMTDLHNDGADRWFTECAAGWPHLFYALADTGRKIGMEYQEGDDPSYLYYTDAVDHTRGFVDVYSRGHMVSMYHYQYRRDEIGNQASLAQEGSLSFGFARSWGLPAVMVYPVGPNWGEDPDYWQGILKPSIAIRALQFRVRDIMLIGLTDEKAKQTDVPALKQWVARLVAKNAAENRPVLNVVAHLPRGEGDHWHDFASSGDAITSGAFHAGWDVISSTEPLPDADAYYVYTTGTDSRGVLDLTPEIAALFAGEKTVFLQIGADLPSGGALTANWRQALSACGVDPEAKFTSGDMPKQGTYKGTPFTYTGIYTAYEVRERPHGTIIPRTAVRGVVSAGGGDVPMIVSSGNKHLIPANSIRWQMMYPIGDLLAGCGAKASSDVWGIAGEEVSILLATHDTELDLVIPKLARGAQIRVTQWDKFHQIIHEESVTYTGSFHRAMKQFDSILIESL